MSTANLLEKKTSYAFVDFERENVVDFSNAALNTYPAVLRPYLSADLQNEMLSLNYRLERHNEDAASLRANLEQLRVNQRVYALRKMFEEASTLLKSFNEQTTQSDLIVACEPFLKAWLLLYEKPLELHESNTQEPVMALIHLAQDLLYALKEGSVERAQVESAKAETLLAQLKQAPLLTLEKGTLKFLFMSWLSAVKKFPDLVKGASKQSSVSEDPLADTTEGRSVTRVKSTLSSQYRKQKQEKVVSQPKAKTRSEEDEQAALEQHLSELNAHWEDVSSPPLAPLRDLFRNLQILVLNLILNILRPLSPAQPQIETNLEPVATPKSDVTPTLDSAHTSGFAPLIDRNIVFYTNFGKPLCVKRPYGISKLEEDLALETALESIRQCAHFVKDMPPVEKGVFKGKVLFELMKEPQKKHLSLFLGFVDKHPKSYIGKNYKISETYATWLANNSPLAL
jgi:hypothetical protein